MPDLDDFHHFDEGLPVNPLPASEVRRRGDRMRRRNTVLATVGGVTAALVFVGTPVALVAAGGDGGDGVRPAPAPNSTRTTDAPQTKWLTAIPDSFPLDTGFPKTSREGSVSDTPDEVALVRVCGQDGWRVSGAVDAWALDHEGDSENRENRTLLLYPDDAAAREAVDAIRAGVLECPTAPGTSDQDFLYNTLDLDLGTEESFVFTEQVSHDDQSVSGLTVTEVGRSGNAVLFVSSYGSAGGPDVEAFETNRLRAAAGVPVAAMCMFSAEPCSTPPTDSVPPDPTPEPTPPASEALADFPLDLGYPETNGGDGSPVEVTGKPGLGTVVLCGEVAWDPAVNTTDVIGVEYAGEAEDFRGRTLAIYASESAAADAVRAAVDAVRSCPEEDAGAESGTTNVYTGCCVGLGDQSTGWTQRYRVDEVGFDTGLTVYHLVRVGHAVYGSFEYGEGGGSAESRDNAMDHAIGQAIPIVEAMREL